MLNYTLSPHAIHYIIWDLDGTLDIIPPNLESVIESNYLKIYAEKKCLPVNDATKEQLRQESKGFCSRAGYLAKIGVKNADIKAHISIDRRKYVQLV